MSCDWEGLNNVPTAGRTDTGMPGDSVKSFRARIQSVASFAVLLHVLVSNNLCA